MTEMQLGYSRAAPGIEGKSTQGPVRYCFAKLGYYIGPADFGMIARLGAQNFFSFLPLQIIHTYDTVSSTGLSVLRVPA